VIPELSPDADLALFRALQEALSNIARHARAHTIDVRVTVTDAALQLTVRDDGRGFPLSADGALRESEGRMGLTGMRERMHAVGGSVVVRNHESGGEVCISMPIAVREVA
jgi:signal transduction histidine kinase